MHKTLLNSVQKLCGTGFSQFLLLHVALGPTSLWESYSCRPPLISPTGSVPVRATDKALISWEKSRKWEIRQQTKTIWHDWNALHERIWKWQYFHYDIWEWLFQLARNSWEIIKRDNTPYIWKIKHWPCAPTLVENSISYYYNLMLTFLRHRSYTFLPILVVTILRIKTIEQNIALKQLKGTPRSMTVQLLLKLM